MVAVEGDTVYLDLGEQSGVQVGQEFVVFRRGEPFRHPITGKQLGQYENVLGHAQVRSVSAEFSEALFVPGRDQPSPRPEDGVRISRGRIKVAVTPLLDLTGGTADVRRVPYLFASVLDRTKRFQVVDPFAVTDMFASGEARVEEVLARPARATQIARNLDVSGLARAHPDRAARDRVPRRDLHLRRHGHRALLATAAPHHGECGGGAALSVGTPNRGLSHRGRGSAHGLRAALGSRAGVVW